jgi:hypothetical protein
MENTENKRLKINSHLKQFPLPDILIDIQRSEKTGILEVKNGHVCKKIYIKNGDIIFAASNQEDFMLGAVLIKAGKITLEQFHQSLAISKKTGTRLGTILVKLGYLEPNKLVWAVTHQVEEIILSLFQWEEGDFEFREGPLPTDEVITLKISVANLIYRGIKRINSFSYFKNVCPPWDAIIEYSSDPLDLFQAIKLDEEDREILSFIDGRSKIKDLLSLSSLNDFKTLKILYALLSVRMIHVKEKFQIKDLIPKGISKEQKARSDSAFEANLISKEILKEQRVRSDSAFEAQVEEFYDRLNSINYYDLLGVTKKSSSNEIKKTYYKKAKDFHPDRHFDLSSDVMKKKLNAIFSFLTLAYKTLNDQKLRKKGQ